MKDCFKDWSQSTGEFMIRGAGGSGPPQSLKLIGTIEQNGQADRPS